MPQATAYLAANLLKHGHEVQCLDALAEGIDHIGVSYAPSIRYRGLSTEAIVGRIKSAPDAIGVSAQFSQDWPHVEGIINAIHTRFPDVPIIVGGEHATALPEHTLNTCSAVKYVALGEGELTLVEFADFLDGKRELDSVKGICYLGADRSVNRTSQRPRLHTPDDLPWPAWELFDLEPYFRTGEGHGVERGRSMPLLATRGCPYQCTFCSNPAMWTTRYVMRKPKLVVNEIENYINRYGAQNIDFMDLTAFTRKSWIMDFCNEIQDRSLNITWQLPSGTRVEQMDEECLATMAATGCMNLTLAPESGSERTLKEIKKRVKLSQVFMAVRYAKRQKIFLKCNLIIGFPTERRKDIWQTLWTSLRFSFMGVEDLALNLFSPYPGSELFSYLQTTGKIKKIDHSYFEDLMTFQNIRRSTYFCETIGARELGFYRLVGLCSFYGFSYLLHPSRIVRTIRNYKAHRSDTVFEERLFALFHRRQIEKATFRRQVVASDPSSLGAEVKRRDSLPSGVVEPASELVVLAEPMPVAERKRKSVTPSAVDRP
jgi:radical SAM superfamily enzyme YgiQ (UPF0313 family)